MTRKFKDIELLMLADFLECEVKPLEERIQRRKLDMNRWCADRDWLTTRINYGNPNSCGTVACAGGFATVIFHKRGLQLKMTEGEISTPSYLGYKGFSALQHFFGLSDDEANRIFSGGRIYDNDVDSVVLSIREFVAQKWEQEGM